MSLTLRHAPPPPLSTLVEVRRSGSRGRRRVIASLHGCTLELRRAADAPPDAAHCVLDARADDASSAGRPAITLVLARDCGDGDGGGAAGAALKIFLFTRKKHELWLAGLRQAARWKVESFYGWADGGGVYGSGLFAEVRKGFAIDGDLAGQRVAVKVVRKAAAVAAAGRADVPVHPKLADFVRRESAICRIVRHPDIAEVYDVFESPSALSVVMRVYPLTLQMAVEAGGALHEAAAAEVARSLLRALLYLHDSDIVHRDVNASNVLLDRPAYPFKAVLCDFGLANFVDRRAAHARLHGLRRQALDGDSGGHGEAAAGVGAGHKENVSFSANGALDGCTFSSAIGAPAYIAPEIVERERYGAPVDAWGAGVMLYYVLSGRLPFASAESRASDPAQILDAVRDAHLSFDDPVWSATSPAALSLIRSLLNPDQRKRMTVEAALAHPWIVSPPPPPAVLLEAPAGGGPTDTLGDLAVVDAKSSPVSPIPRRARGQHAEPGAPGEDGAEGPLHITELSV